MFLTKIEIKSRDMEKLSRYIYDLRCKPKLTYLFVELTDSCNLSCLHCGSNCNQYKGTYIDTNILLNALETIAEDFEPHTVMICLTGGEPMIHRDFYRIAEKIVELGFPWGITTNGTLIDKQSTKMLKRLKLGSITISVDGLENTHDRLRRVQGSFRKAVNAVEALQTSGIQVQVTSVIHKENFHE